MSTVPTNPMYDAIRNWQRVATEMIGGWRARGETIRSNWYKRFAGPQPAGRVGPLMRLRAAGARTGGVQRVTPFQAGRIIPHAAQPGVETYDYTYRGPMLVPPFTTQKRLGLENEPYDFTF